MGFFFPCDKVMKGKMKDKMDALLTSEIKLSYLPGAFLLRGDPTPPQSLLEQAVWDMIRGGTVTHCSSQLPPLPADGNVLTNNEWLYLINTLGFC